MFSNEYFIYVNQKEMKKCSRVKSIFQITYTYTVSLKYVDLAKDIKI